MCKCSCSLKGSVGYAYVNKGESISYLLDVNLLLSVTADRPCAPREFGSGNIVCVCNMTYCDTIAKLSAVPADQFVQYSTSQSGLRFHKSLGSLVDSPHSTGNRLAMGPIY